MQKSDWPRITAERLEAYQSAAMANAERLLTEAKLLLENRHFPRAYFLAVATIEEVGKAMIAFDARGRNLRDSAVQSKVSRLLADHEAKIRTAFTGFLEADARKNAETAVKLIIALQRGREPAMYTDLLSDGSIRSPSAVVAARQAIDCVRLARDCLASAEAHAGSKPPTARTAAQDQWFALKSSESMKVVNKEDFWWYFINRMEGGHKDMAEAVMKYRSEYLLQHRKFKNE